MKYKKNVEFLHPTHQLTIIDTIARDSKTISFVNSDSLELFFEDVKNFFEDLKNSTKNDINIKVYPKKISSHVITLRSKLNNKSKSLTILLEHYSCDDIMKKIKKYFCWEK